MQAVMEMADTTRTEGQDAGMSEMKGVTASSVNKDVFFVKPKLALIGLIPLGEPHFLLPRFHLLPTNHRA